MGLSIHYSGRFNPDASLQEFIEEVKDIAEIYNWEYHIYETTFPSKIDKVKYSDKIYGISFTPDECETVGLEFLSNMRMSSSVHLKYFGNSENKDYQNFLYMLSVKTQYAGVKVHQIIIHLFKYLNEKYFLDFKMRDEGKYWETGDEKVLIKQFSEYNKLLDSVCDGIQSFPTKEGESIVSYFQRLMEHLNNQRKKD